VVGEGASTVLETMRESRRWLFRLACGVDSSGRLVGGNGLSFILRSPGYGGIATPTL